MVYGKFSFSERGGRTTRFWDDTSQSDRVCGFN
jgi:hypothetical protein